MSYRLLLVDGRGAVVCPELRVRMLREFPGAARLSVHFRPVRNDLLFDSAKVGGDLAYRVLCGEHIVRSQLMVEYEVAGSQVNVMGRSAELLFALTLITAKWKRAAGDQATIAATGTLAGDGAVGSVERTAEKVAAATRDLSAGNDAARAIIFYPAEDAASVDAWRLNAAIPKHIELFAVSHLDDALERLGYRLEKVYLRNPFRGLEHFDYADHAVFFGRDTEVRQAVEQLLRREQADAPGLLVEGASGSGKSSFLRAGVLHALADPRFLSQAAQEALASRPISATVSRAIWRLGLSDASSDEQQIVAAIAGVWAQLPEFPADWQQPPIASFEELAIRLHHRWPRSARFVTRTSGVRTRHQGLRDAAQLSGLATTLCSHWTGARSYADGIQARAQNIQGSGAEVCENRRLFFTIPSADVVMRSRAAQIVAQMTPNPTRR